MLRLWLARSGLQRLPARAGLNPKQVQALLPASSHWSRDGACMIKILDLPLLVDRLGPLPRRRASAAGVRGRFVLRSPSHTGLLNLGMNRRQRLELSEQALVGFLFSLRPLAECRGGPPGPASYGLILPLPLYVPALDHS